MNRMTRKSTFRRAVTAALSMAMGVSMAALAGPLSTYSPSTYWPWESISVTSHYDGNGALVGVEAVGACGFSLIGDTGTSTIQRSYSCDQLNEIEMPF